MMNSVMTIALNYIASTKNASRLHFISCRRRSDRFIREIMAGRRRTEFTGLKLVLWLGVLVRFDGILMEKPPTLVTDNDIQKRLDNSKVEPDQINNIHFTQVNLKLPLQAKKI